MAIFHFSAKVIGRSSGGSAVAGAAYRSASELHDERLGRNHDFTNKFGVIHSEVMLPKGAPEKLADRQTLWNTVEAGEKRKDAQLAREVEFAIPRELSERQGVELARAFVAEQFVKRGMVADLNVHWDKAKDGSPKPHAHVMLSMREVGPDGFGKKVREWNGAELLKGWREAWAVHANEKLAELGHAARIDHRSYASQGIQLEPQHKIGPAASRRPGQGLEAERIEDHQRIAQANGERIIADPNVALAAITRQQATFTMRDLAAFAFRHSDGKEQFDAVMAAVRGAPELVKLGTDRRGDTRYTSAEMIEVEERLREAGDRLATGRGGRSHAVGERAVAAALAAAEGRGVRLGAEQRTAFLAVTGARGLSSVVGYAGSGKSAMLGGAREAWSGAGYRVQGMALSGIAAEALEGGSGIASRTIASLEHAWAKGQELPDRKTVLVVDEAGMVGSRQMERVLTVAAKAGAKVVLVGDPEQLQAIEAGAAFRSIVGRHGAVEITEVRRQREGWQQRATRALATGRTGEALAAYREQGMVVAHATPDDARAAVLRAWDEARAPTPGVAPALLMMAHTRAEVRALNYGARELRRAGGELGPDVAVATARGERVFAVGDRVMFGRNDRELGVRNGTLGDVVAVNADGMRVTVAGEQLMKGAGAGSASSSTSVDARASAPSSAHREVAIAFASYAHIDHGYASTVHKAQGQTVDRAFVLAGAGMDRHMAYSALTRHRLSVELHHDRETFRDDRALAAALERERAKDMAGDYTPEHRFAARREVRPAAELLRAWKERVVHALGLRATNESRSRTTSAPAASQEPPKQGQLHDEGRTTGPIEASAVVTPAAAGPVAAAADQLSRTDLSGVRAEALAPADGGRGQRLHLAAVGLANLERHARVVREAGGQPGADTAAAIARARAEVGRLMPDAGALMAAVFTSRPDLLEQAAAGRTAGVLAEVGRAALERMGAPAAREPVEAVADRAAGRGEGAARGAGPSQSREGPGDGAPREPDAALPERASRTAPGSPSLPTRVAAPAPATSATGQVPSSSSPGSSAPASSALASAPPAADKPEQERERDPDRDRDHDMSRGPERYRGLEM